MCVFVKPFSTTIVCFFSVSTITPHHTFWMLFSWRCLMSLSIHFFHRGLSCRSNLKIHFYHSNATTIASWAIGESEFISIERNHWKFFFATFPKVVKRRKKIGSCNDFISFHFFCCMNAAAAASTKLALTYFWTIYLCWKLRINYFIDSNERSGVK